VSAAFDHEVLLRRAKRFYAETPHVRLTVRRVARSLRWAQTRVEDAIDGDPEATMQLTSFAGARRPPLGDHFLEVVDG